MRSSVLLVICLVVSAAPLILSPDAHGQEQGYGGGVYGYTSLDFTPSTNELTGYSETDEDGLLLTYYRPNVSAYLNDLTHNKGLGSSMQSGYSTASVTLYATGTPQTTYEMSAYHYLTLQQISWPGPGNPSGYNDWAGLVDYSYFNLDDPYISTYTGNVYPSGTIPTPDIIEGSTYDMASFTTPNACGDVRDQIINEYSTYLVALTPACNTFTSALSGPYTLTQLSPNETSTYKPWAIIQSYMPSSLSTVQGIVSGSITITSGYRNPSAEWAAAQKNNVKPAHNSRHMYGDAVDLGTSSNVSYWKKVQAAGHSAGACVEPSSLSSYSHAHLDWRTKYGTTINCPTNW